MTAPVVTSPISSPIISVVQAPLSQAGTSNPNVMTWGDGTTVKSGDGTNTKWGSQ